MPLTIGCQGSAGAKKRGIAAAGTKLFIWIMGDPKTINMSMIEYGNEYVKLRIRTYNRRDSGGPSVLIDG